MNHLNLEFEPNHAEFYVATLTLGILSAMQSGILSLEMGIWTLGRPHFLDKVLPFCSPPLQEILMSMDELDAMQTLCGAEVVQSYIAEKIQILHNIISTQKI